MRGSDVQRGMGAKPGALYSEVPCIMGTGHMGTLLDRQTDTTENITFLQLRSWPVIKVVGIFQKLVMIGRKALGKFQKCDRT